MRRGHKPQSVLSGTEQPIGHISTPIEDDDLQRVQAILKCHGVELRKIRTPDNWWMLLLPDGTMKTRKEMREKVPISTVRLPDGFTFLFEEGIFTRDGTYATPPKVFVEQA